jgi:hypothetical protein
MKTLIELYVLRYGPVDALTELADGFRAASEADSTGYTETGKRILLDASTEIYNLRNLLRDKWLAR